MGAVRLSRAGARAVDNGDPFRDTSIDKGLVGAGLDHFFASTFVQHVTAHIAGEDKAAYLDEWGQPGAMTAMLTWYRASSIVVPPVDGPLPDRPAFLSAPFPPVTQPTLVIWGTADKALAPRPARRAGRAGAGPNGGDGGRGPFRPMGSAGRGDHSDAKTAGGADMMTATIQLWAFASNETISI